MRGTTTRQATMLSTLTSDSLIRWTRSGGSGWWWRRCAPELDAMYARTGRLSWLLWRPGRAEHPHPARGAC
jgi:hypothetical protein